MVRRVVRVHYVTQGEGPLIVLLHGFPEFWYSWRLQIPFLANSGYTVVAPDLRGYNDTEKPPTGYDVPTLLRDIVGLIKGLGQEKAIILRQSLCSACLACGQRNSCDRARRIILPPSRRL